MTVFTIKAVLAAVIIYLFQSKSLAEGTTIAKNIEEEFSKQDVINSVQEIGREISYAQWVKDPLKNVILSPLSIAVILNLLMLGTNGTANSEIKQALNYPNNLQENVVHETYQDIFTTLPQSRNGLEISLHTRLFPQKEFSILKSYTDVSEKSYQSKVESLDYENSPVGSTNRINNWVSKSTNGKIRELFPQPLSSQTVCVIANVIFLNATWLNKFYSSSTKDGSFHTGTETISIPMMRRKMSVPYRKFENEGFELISLPYVGNRYSMYILKPTSVSNLQQIEKSLNSNDLNSFINQMQFQEMDVTIPRMRLSFEFNLKEDLKSLGIRQIFTTSADLKRFTNDPRVYFSDVVHKAILEITEAGTVAAAVTAAVFTTTSVTSPPKVFKLDHPSLVFIRDNEKGLTLFWGRVIKPDPFQG